MIQTIIKTEIYIVKQIASQSLQNTLHTKHENNENITNNDIKINTMVNVNMLYHHYVIYMILWMNLKVLRIIINQKVLIK